MTVGAQVDDSEVGLLESVADVGGSDDSDAPDSDLLEELIPAEFSELLDDNEMPPSDEADESQDEDQEDEPEEEDEGEEEEESEEDDDDSEADKSEPEPKGRAAKRIQKLLTEKKEMEANFERSQAQLAQQVQGALAQQQQRYEGILAQMSQQLQQQQEALDRRARVEEEAGLSEVEKFRRKTLDEATERVMGQVSPYIKQLEARIQAQDERAAQKDRVAQSRARVEEFTNRTRKVRDEVLLAGIDAEFSEDERELLNDMLLSYVAGKDVEPENAGPGFRSMIEKLHAGLLNSKAKTAKAAKKGKKPKPPPATPGRRPAKQGTQRPSWNALMADGRYSNYIQWKADGSPRIAEPK